MENSPKVNKWILLLSVLLALSVAFIFVLQVDQRKQKESLTAANDTVLVLQQRLSDMETELSDQAVALESARTALAASESELNALSEGLVGSRAILSAGEDAAPAPRSGEGLTEAQAALADLLDQLAAAQAALAESDARQETADNTLQAIQAMLATAMRSLTETKPSCRAGATR